MGFYDWIQKQENKVQHVLAPGPLYKIDQRVRNQVKKIFFGSPGDPIRNEGEKLKDLSVQSSAYGSSVPEVIAPTRIAGEIIWATAKVATAHTTTSNAGSSGGFGGGGVEIITTDYTYAVSIAVSLCNCRNTGPISGISKIWANGELIYNIEIAANFQSVVSSLEQVKALRFYTGTTTQNPDSLIVLKQTNAPAYRTLAYCVFEDFQLQKWNNEVPNLEFEIFPVGSFSSQVVYIDPAGRFNVTDGQYPVMNMSIMLDGNLAVAEGTSSQAYKSYTVCNPFTLNKIKTISNRNDLGSISPTVAPQINQQGDLLTGQYYLRNGGSPAVSLGIDFFSNTEMDLSGNFYVACRISSPPDVAGIKRINLNGTIDTVYKIENGIGLTTQIFLTHDGYIYLAVHNGSSGVLRKIDLATGTVVRSTATGFDPMAFFVVCSNESVFYSRYGGRQHNYLAPDWSTITVLFDYGVAPPFWIENWQRDWRNGGAITGLHGEYRIYDNSGALVTQLNPAAPAVTFYQGRSHIRFTDRHYWCQTLPGLSNVNASLVSAPRLSLSGGSVNLSSAISKICQSAGLTTGEIDVTGITDILSGYSIGAQMPAKQALDPLISAYFLQVTDTGTKLKFHKRGATPVLTIPVDDFLIPESGADFSPDQVDDIEESELPREVNIRYRDATRNYLADSQYDRRLVTTAQNVETLDYQMSFSPTQARRIASTKLYDMWMSRKTHSFILSRKYARLEPGDVITIQPDGISTNVLIRRIRDDSGKRIIDATEDESSLFTQVSTGAGGATQSTTVATVPTTIPIFLDISLLSSANDDYGFFVGGYGSSGWTGARLFKSTDGGTTYVDLNNSITTTSVVGVTLTKLGNFFSGNIFDELNTLDITLNAGTMTSITQSQAESDTLDILIGDEIIACKNRVSLGGVNYRLSGFLRGRYGTEWAMPLHYLGDQVIVLDSSVQKSISSSASEIGVNYTYSAVSFGGYLDLGFRYTFKFLAERLRPRASTQLGGGRNASGDIIATWIPRSRKSFGWTDGVDVPLDEPTEAYEVDFFAGTALTITSIVVRANASEITFSGAHGLAVNDQVYLHSINGMVQLNERTATVTIVNSTTIATVNIDPTNYTAYTSAGNALKRKPSGTITATTPTVTYTSAQQITDFAANQSPIRFAVYKMSSRVGRGIAATGIL